LTSKVKRFGQAIAQAFTPDFSAPAAYAYAA